MSSAWLLLKCLIACPHSLVGLRATLLGNADCNGTLWWKLPPRKHSQRTAGHDSGRASTPQAHVSSSRCTDHHLNCLPSHLADCKWATGSRAPGGMLRAAGVHACRQTLAHKQLAACPGRHGARLPARRRQVASPRSQAPPPGGSAGAFPGGSDAEFDPPSSQAAQPGHSSSFSGSGGGGGAGAGPLEALRVSCLPRIVAHRMRQYLMHGARRSG